MREYRIIINNQEFIIKQDIDGKFIKPDIIKEYEKNGTALKPSFEPIIVARKPVEGTIVENVMKYGVGGLNIDECRIEHDEELKLTNRVGRGEDTVFNSKNSGFVQTNNHIASTNPDGRFPANTILTYDQMTFDEVCGGFPETKGGIRHNTAIRQSEKNSGYGFDVNTRNEYNDSGSACRYFYCAKASKKDREEGLDDFEEKKVTDGRKTKVDNAFQRGETLRHNIHPTVKPMELMQYLVRLITPNNGIVLDPFMGSGSTGKACMYENLERSKNYRFIGIEKDEEYCKIAKARIKYVENKINEVKEV